MEKQYFTLEESPFNPGKYVISPIHENFLLKSTEGSYNVICARLMNLSYAQYLRFCRDMCHAEIIGKGHKYPVAYFKKDGCSSAFVRLLNTRAKMIMWAHDHPKLNTQVIGFLKEKYPEVYNDVFNPQSS